MSSTYFISDLHLSTTRPDISRALAAFLQQHTGCDQLYILGDLFEVWVGDDDDAALAQDTAAALRAFSAAGPDLFLMQGNRDFMLGETFCQSAGGQLLPDPTVIELDGEPTLLMHGDSLCTADKEYQQFRKTARDPQWQAALMAESLEQRRAFAAQLRGKSKEANSNKAEDIMDVTPADVELIMAEHDVRQLIHGHTHRPAHHDEPTGSRWVLGDWDTKGWAIEASAGNINLYNFDI